MYELLEELGFTKAQVRVYIALLQLGTSTKHNIVKKAEISDSKFYILTEQLIKKGIVSFHTKNNIKQFSAATPQRILELFDEKINNAKKQKKEFETLIPKLPQHEASTSVELFQGWGGLQSVYDEIIHTLQPGEKDLVIGAHKGYNPIQAELFFSNFLKKRHKKGIKYKVIFEKESEDYARMCEKNSFTKLEELRFIDQKTPAEINIFNEKVAIVILKKEPIAILIRSKEVSEHFKKYFDVVWQQATN